MTKPRSTAAPIIVAIVLLVLPVLYILSIGPMYCMAGNGVVFRAVYTPLIWILDNGPSPIDHWLDNYIMWWKRIAT